jgi:carbonic anhydrase
LKTLYDNINKIPIKKITKQQKDMTTEDCFNNAIYTIREQFNNVANNSTIRHGDKSKNENLNDLQCKFMLDLGLSYLT